MIISGVTVKSQSRATVNAVTELQAKVNGPANLLAIKLIRQTPETKVVKISTRPTL